MANTNPVNQDILEWQSTLPSEQKKLFGTIFGLLAIVVSVLLAWTSWWFIESVTITQAFGIAPANTWITVLSWLIPLGLLFAAIACAVAAFFTALRHSRAADMLVFASKVAIIFLIVTAINVLFVANDSSFVAWFSNFLNHLTNLS